MTTITYDKTEWTRLRNDAPFLGSACLKTIDPRITPRTGVLTAPDLHIGEGGVNSDAEMHAAIAQLDVREVVVTGHGYPTDLDFFVWRGTPQEFRETWIGD